MVSTTITWVIRPTAVMTSGLVGAEAQAHISKQAVSQSNVFISTPLEAAALAGRRSLPQFKGRGQAGDPDEHGTD
ncbi:MAG: hypothetical protein C0460_00930 [Methylibium sp.]|nr:hypothetical protein [Methylibium sp.]